ncbi:hypothetical protein ACLMJK_007544 [Lecanora helva]
MESSSVWANIQTEPVAPPPPGVMPNHINPASYVSGIYIAASMCLPIITLSAALRFYAKSAILDRWTWDDVTFTIGLCAEIIFIALFTAEVNEGAYGKHAWDVTVQEFTAKSQALAMVIEVVYGPFIWFIKLSLFVMYVQIFRPIRWLRYFAYAGALISGLFYFATSIIYLALCAPRNDRSAIGYMAALNAPRCHHSRDTINTVLGVVNVTSDMYLIILPLPAVWKLQLPFRQKLAVAGMFFTGSFACIASAFGLYYRIQLGRDPDFTWLFVNTAIVSFTEFTAGVLVCCMPSMTAVFKHLKTPLSTKLSSGFRSLQSVTRLGAGSGYKGSIVADDNLDGQEKHAGENGPATNMVRVQRSNPRSLGAEAAMEEVQGWPWARKEGQIRKTTDIYVTRQIHP